MGSAPSKNEFSFSLYLDPELLDGEVQIKYREGPPPSMTIRFGENTAWANITSLALQKAVVYKASELVIEKLKTILKTFESDHTKRASVIVMDKDLVINVENKTFLYENNWIFWNKIPEDVIAMHVAPRLEFQDLSALERVVGTRYDKAWKALFARDFPVVYGQLYKPGKIDVGVKSMLQSMSMPDNVRAQRYPNNLKMQKPSYWKLYYEFYLNPWPKNSQAEPSGFYTENGVLQKSFRKSKYTIEAKDEKVKIITHDTFDNHQVILRTANDETEIKLMNQGNEKVMSSRFFAIRGTCMLTVNNVLIIYAEQKVVFYCYKIPDSNRYEHQYLYYNSDMKINVETGIIHDKDAAYAISVTGLRRLFPITVENVVSCTAKKVLCVFNDWIVVLKSTHDKELCVGQLVEINSVTAKVIAFNGYRIIVFAKGALYMYSVVGASPVLIGTLRVDPAFKAKFVLPTVYGLAFEGKYMASIKERPQLMSCQMCGYDANWKNTATGRLYCSVKCSDKDNK